MKCSPSGPLHGITQGEGDAAKRYYTIAKENTSCTLKQIEKLSCHTENFIHKIFIRIKFLLLEQAQMGG